MCAYLLELPLLCLLIFASLVGLPIQLFCGELVEPSAADETHLKT